MVNVYISPTLQLAIAATPFNTDLGGAKEGAYHGDMTNGGETVPLTFAVAHDHTDPTVNAYLYFTKLTPAAGETYDGSFNPDSDWARLLAWGDLDDGLKVEFDWYNGAAYSEILQTGNMDLIGTSVQVPAVSMAYDNTGVTTLPSSPVDGQIYPIGSGSKATKGEGASFKVKLVCPTSETMNGFLEWDSVLIMEWAT